MIPSILKRVSHEFSSLVLGPEPSIDEADFQPEANKSLSLSIPKSVRFIKQLERQKGLMIEIIASEPEEMEEFIELLISEGEERSESIALLGVEQGRWERDSLVVMPSQRASHILFAAHQFVQSNAIDLILIQEILLKTDSLAGFPNRMNWVMDELKKLKRLVNEKNALVLFVNPNTSERKYVLGELQIICSHQLELLGYEEGRE